MTIFLVSCVFTAFPGRVLTLSVGTSCALQDQVSVLVWVSKKEEEEEKKTLLGLKMCLSKCGQHPSFTSLELFRDYSLFITTSFRLCEAHT